MYDDEAGETFCEVCGLTVHEGFDCEDPMCTLEVEEQYSHPLDFTVDNSDPFGFDNQIEQE